MNLNDYMSAAEFARREGCSRQRVTEWVAQGRLSVTRRGVTLAPVRVGDRLLVPRAAKRPKPRPPIPGPRKAS